MAGSEPLVFQPPWRPWWRPGVAFAAFIAAALIAVNAKGTLDLPADVLIGGGGRRAVRDALRTGPTGTPRAGRDRWLDDRAAIPFARSRTFDAREVAFLHWRDVRAGARSFGLYEVRLRGRERIWQRFRLPVTVYADEAGRLCDELLSQVAAAADVDADPRTAEVLEAWRRVGPGTNPPVRHRLGVELVDVRAA